MNSRREFIVKRVPAAGAAVLLSRMALAQSLPAMTEADPMGKAMGFVLDTAKADQAKYPKHAKDQSCTSCIHYAKPGADSAKCDLFSKSVPKGGWCSGYSKRP
jgi:hypothetical protein